MWGVGYVVGVVRVGDRIGLKSDGMGVVSEEERVRGFRDVIEGLLWGVGVGLVDDKDVVRNVSGVVVESIIWVEGEMMKMKRVFVMGEGEGWRGIGVVDWGIFDVNRG